LGLGCLLCHCLAVGEAVCGGGELSTRSAFELYGIKVCPVTLMAGPIGLNSSLLIWLSFCVCSVFFLSVRRGIHQRYVRLWSSSPGSSYSCPASSGSATSCSSSDCGRRIFRTAIEPIPLHSSSSSSQAWEREIIFYPGTNGSHYGHDQGAEPHDGLSLITGLVH